MIKVKISGESAEEISSQIFSLAQAFGHGKAVTKPAAKEPEEKPEAPAKEKAPVKPEAAKEEKPKQKPAKAPEAKQEAPVKPEAAKETVDLLTLRKFCAEAMKKGGVNSAGIIKEVSGGKTKLNDIDASLYQTIYDRIQQAWDEKKGA